MKTQGRPVSNNVYVRQTVAVQDKLRKKGPDQTAYKYKDVPAQAFINVPSPPPTSMPPGYNVPSVDYTGL